MAQSPWGQTDTSLNPVEKLTGANFLLLGAGAIKWTTSPDVALIASDATSISIRYDTTSPSAKEPDASWIEASQGDETARVERTVFTATWGNFNNGGDNNAETPLDTADQLSFDPIYGGSDVKQRGASYLVGFNWYQENGAKKIAAKVEDVLTFSPTGIQWDDRGFVGTSGKVAGVTTGSFTFWREKIGTNMVQPNSASYRGLAANIVTNVNDADWTDDGAPVVGHDVQYPSNRVTDKAFYIDVPTSDPSNSKQLAYRFDARDMALWKTADGWLRTGLLQSQVSPNRATTRL